MEVSARMPTGPFPSPHSHLDKVCGACQGDVDDLVAMVARHHKGVIALKQHVHHIAIGQGVVIRVAWAVLEARSPSVRQ